MVAHNLNDAATVVALGGVAQFIDSLDSSVHGCVVTDGVFTAGNVVIDGAGQADAGDALVGQRTGTHEGAVTANDDQCVDAQFFAAGKALGLAFLGLELQAACRIEDRAAAVDDLRYAADVHFVNFAIDQAVVATLDTHHAVTFADASANDCANGGIHAGGVSSAGQDADPLYHICHGAFLLMLSFFLKVFSLWHVTPPVSSVRPSLTSNESPYTLNPKITFWEKQLNFQHTFPYIITALDAFPCRLSRILPNHIFLC